MKEEKIIKKQLIKNMILNLIAFTIIFSILGIIIFLQVNTSLYLSADEELSNIKNREGILKNFQIGNNIINRQNKQNIVDIVVPPNVSENENNQAELKKNIKENVNPRLIYIYRNEDGSISENENSRFEEDFFKEISFDSKELDKIYNVVITNQYKYRGINYKIEKEDGEIVYAQVLINVDAENTILENFTKTLIVSIICSITLAIIASYILSKKTMRPIIKSWQKQTEFVQNASHELRTPLTIIQAKQELLLDEPQSKIIDKAEEITISLNETKRLAKLVKDLMSLARADSDKVEIKKEKVEVDELIKQVIMPFKEIAEAANKKILLELNYGKTINADRNKIHQLLIILLDNAIKYTEKGDAIQIETQEKENKFVLIVGDTGIGISDEGLNRIFDRFYREDKARNRQTGGTGLGLSIAKFIVEQHNGTIKAMHNIPKGTKFEIKLKI